MSFFHYNLLYVIGIIFSSTPPKKNMLRVKGPTDQPSNLAGLEKTSPTRFFVFLPKGLVPISDKPEKDDGTTTIRFIVITLLVI